MVFCVSLCAGILLLPGQVPPGYYDGTGGLYGDDLKAVLHNIIDDHDEPSYSDLRDFILPEADEDPGDPNNIILLYTGRSQLKSTFGGGPDEWNREHVWAKSHGDFGNEPPCGTDAHMVRPTDASVNADRGSRDFDTGGQQHPEATGCYYTEFTWEPRDEVKGDVARMILYMDVRYEGDNGEPDLTAVDAVNTAPAPEHGRLSTLLQWHEDDPPDDFEMNRNNVVYTYQGNRNPFIDRPDFVSAVWDPLAGMEEINIKAGFYPNPVRDVLHINCYTPCEGLTLEVINSFGYRVVRRITHDDTQIQLDCSLMPAGLYVLRLSTEQNMGTYVSSFIKIN